MSKPETAFGNMSEAVANLIHVGYSWLDACELRRASHDLKGDLQIRERNTATDLADALHEVKAHQLQRHPDDLHVDAMADAMKVRLATKRAEGRGGWDDAEQCAVEYLAALLVGSLLRGNAIDVANYAMMLHRRAARPGVLADALVNHCARACPPTLEGLADELLTPRTISRDADGHLIHPALPALDEDVCMDTFLQAFGIETAFVDMASDDHAALDRYLDANSADCSDWTPSRPRGENWILTEIYDTEDGPCAMYVRRRPPAPRLPRTGRAVAVQGTLTRLRHLSGDITLTLDHAVPQHFRAGARVSLQLLRGGHVPDTSEAAASTTRQDNRHFYAETVAEQEAASRPLPNGSKGTL